MLGTTQGRVPGIYLCRQAWIPPGGRGGGRLGWAADAGRGGAVGRRVRLSTGPMVSAAGPAGPGVDKADFLRVLGRIP